ADVPAAFLRRHDARQSRHQPVRPECHQGVRSPRLPHHPVLGRSATGNFRVAADHRQGPARHPCAETLRPAKRNQPALYLTPTNPWERRFRREFAAQGPLLHNDLVKSRPKGRSYMIATPIFASCVTSANIFSSFCASCSICASSVWPWKIWISVCTSSFIIGKRPSDCGNNSAASATLSCWLRKNIGRNARSEE